MIFIVFQDMAFSPRVVTWQLGWFKVTMERCLACKQNLNIDGRGERNYNYFLNCVFARDLIVLSFQKILTLLQLKCATRVLN